LFCAAHRLGPLNVERPTSVFWAIAAFEYWHIGRQRYVPLFFWPGLILYSMLGKWGAVWFWGFFGVLFTFVGIWNLVVRICYGQSDDD